MTSPYPWPPTPESLTGLPKELRDGKYPEWPTHILYDAALGAAFETYTKYNATQELLKRARSLLATSGRVLCRDVVYQEMMLEIPLARLAALRPPFDSGYRDQEMDRAVQVSAAVPEVGVGSLLRCNVADGYGWYVVTKARQRTCDVEYRGFGPDDWRDRYIEGLGRKKVPSSYARTLLYRASGLPALRPLFCPVAPAAPLETVVAASAADGAMRAAMESPD